jgi:PhnB protein
MNLDGDTTMAKQKSKPVKEETYPVIPHLVCAGAAKAIAFYKTAFGAEEMMRLPGPHGKIMHACIRINGAPIFLVDEAPSWGSLGPNALKGSPVFIHLTVKDVDAIAKRATDAGAKVTMPVVDMFWGDRYGQLEDPFGHRWSVATHVRDMSLDEIQQAMRQAMQQPAPTKSA